MPIIKSAIKEARKSKKRYSKNKPVKSRLKTTSKRILSTKNYDTAKKLLDTLIPDIQRAILKNTIPKNNGRRKISKLTKYVNLLKNQQ
ncbi:MAG: 30S ribosomal protein S20 [Candidatus Firestonebacteria bacterium]